MKRFVLISVCLLIAGMINAQFEEDFSTTPTGWVLSSGASFGNVNSNAVVVTPGVGGNNPAVIGTPAVSKTSNTIKVCFDVYAYTSNLNTQVPFPCSTFVDILFVNSAVTTANDAALPENIYARLDNYLLPTNGGNTCFQFTLPAEVQAPNFKIFLSFHAGCNQGGIRYVFDNIAISGVDDVCSGGSCAPTALNDVMNRGNMTELSFNAVLYGSNINFPPPPAGYAVDATGTDNDPNDDYSHLQWELVTGPVNGSVTVNADGTCTITRNSITVSQLTFVYRVCDDGPDNNFLTTADNLCDDATVTVNFPVAAITPVSLINYSGTRSETMVTLKWTTTFESNNKGFTIQRSTGNNVYQNTGFVPTKSADGYSNVTLNYEFKEVNNTGGLTWYRLVQEDKDGTMKVYAARAVRGMEESAKMVVYPNPSATGNITVLFGNNSNRKIMISDMSGRMVKQWNNYTDGDLTVTGLKTGVYMLVVSEIGTNNKTVEKIIVTNR